MVQWSPLSTERKMPPPLVPAYSVVGVRGLMARDKTHRLAGLVNPVFTAVDGSPLSVERKTPAPVPAYRVVGVRGLMIRELAPTLGRPRVQCSPLLVERKRPPLVTAYSVVGVLGSMVRPMTCQAARPWVFTAVQVVPLLTERKTPLLVPAYSVVGVTGSMTTLQTTLLASPVFTAVQVVPLLTERKTPPEEVPAYRVVGAVRSISRERTSWLVRPVFSAVHVSPLSVDRKMPRLVLTYRVVGVRASIARMETLPPYSGSCVQIYVSAACVAGARASTPERPKARHKVITNMTDRRVIHFWFSVVSLFSFSWMRQE